MGSEEVVVVGEGVDAVNVVVEIGREPDVLRDNFGRLLYLLTTVLLELGETPAGIASRARFLSNGESDTWFKGTDCKGAFAVTGASRHSDLGNIDIGGGSTLEDIDDT